MDSEQLGRRCGPAGRWQSPTSWSENCSQISVKFGKNCLKLNFQITKSAYLKKKLSAPKSIRTAGKKMWSCRQMTHGWHHYHLGTGDIRARLWGVNLSTPSQPRPEITRILVGMDVTGRLTFRHARKSSACHGTMWAIFWRETSKCTPKKRFWRIGSLERR